MNKDLKEYLGRYAKGLSLKEFVEVLEVPEGKVPLFRSNTILICEADETSQHIKAGFIRLDDVVEPEAVKEKETKTFSQLNADEMKELATMFNVEFDDKDSKADIKEKIEALGFDKKVLNAACAEL